MTRTRSGLIVRAIRCIVAGVLALGLLFGLLWAGLMVILKGYPYFAWTPSFTAIPADPSGLIDTLMSYQTINSATRTLTNAGYEVRREAEDRPLSAQGNPSVTFTIIAVNDFVHLGQVGKLTLRFFNDRLVATIFCPADLPAYLDRLAAQLGIVFSSQEDSEDLPRQEVLLSPHTRVHTRPSYSGIVCPAVIWSDARLDWEERVYASKYED